LYIKWITTKEKNKIYFPNDHQKIKLGTISEKIKFHFGSWSKELSVQFLAELPKDTIGLSANLKNNVFIPDELVYEINLSEESVCIGPVILYLVSERFLKNLSRINERIEKFDPFKGLIMVSTVSGIDTRKQTIKGYYFQPSSEKRKSNWKQAIFSYPGAVFKRVSVSPKLNKHLYKVTNGRIFNSTFFNKWEMWEYLAPDDFIRSHLPDTKELNTLDEILEMLEVYESIYLKPKNGSGGKGIIQIMRADNLFQITTDTNVETNVARIDQHPSIKSVLQLKNQYMIQQGVPIKYHSRNVDFRMYMQKDATKQWKCSGLLARFAKPESITTNLRHLDYLLPGKEAFEQLFGLNKNGVELLEQKVINICKHACQILDQHGCYADIAIDLIIDEKLHIWILEMNKRYGYKSLSLIKDQKLFRKIIRNPFLYASTISGFRIDEE
jgi:hypothetical protein